MERFDICPAVFIKVTNIIVKDNSKAYKYHNLLYYDHYVSKCYALIYSMYMLQICDEVIVCKIQLWFKNKNKYMLRVHIKNLLSES